MKTRSKRDVRDGNQAETVGDTSTTWVSSYHPIHLHLPDGWTLIRPFLDTATSVTIGMVNSKTNQSLVIKVTPDVSDELVPEDLYRDEVIKQMVSAAVGNKLIDESQVVFKGVPFNRMRFLMHSQKFDSMSCQHLFLRRTGVKTIGCQINYPIKTEHDFEMPPEITALLNGVKLFRDGE